MRGLPVWLVALWTSAGMAADNPYTLEPERVAPDTYVFQGEMADFGADNHGNVVNTGFIVTGNGVVVIDTGPSKLYGEAVRAAIAEVTDQSVVRVYVTHHHPGHFLGNQAFADVPVAALPGTIERIEAVGADLAGHLYNLVGGAMRGTVATVPGERVGADTRVRFGDHELSLIATGGHSADDLAVYDHRTGVLFAGDMVFHDRAPTTPDADLWLWLSELADLAPPDMRVVVPGHGPVAHSTAPLQQTAAYIDWLSDTLKSAATRGDSMPEVMFRNLPSRWASLAVMPEEFRRSVSYLYPAIERETLPER